RMVGQPEVTGQSRPPTVGTADLGERLSARSAAAYTAGMSDDAREELRRRLESGAVTAEEAAAALEAMADAQALRGAEQPGTASRQETLAWLESFNITDEELAEAARS